MCGTILVKQIEKVMPLTGETMYIMASLRRGKTESTQSVLVCPLAFVGIFNRYSGRPAPHIWPYFVEQASVDNPNCTNKVFRDMAAHCLNVSRLHL